MAKSTASKSLDAIESLVEMHQARATQEYIGVLLRCVALLKGARLPPLPPSKEDVEKATQLANLRKTIEDTLKGPPDHKGAAWIMDGLKSEGAKKAAAPVSDFEEIITAREAIKKEESSKKSKKKSK